MATSKQRPKTSKAKASSQKKASAKSASVGKSKGPKKPKISKKASEPKGKCFVISPFGGWHDAYYGEIFCPAIKSAGLAPARADDLFRSSNIVHDIWHLVLTSRVLLADLTDKNPNVFYELGLAHAARKPVLLLTQSIEDVPFDLRALRVIEYEVEHPKWGEVLRENIKQGLKEMLESPERSVLPTFLVEEPQDQPQVSKDEARLIGLQQQVDRLQSEIRGSRSRLPSDPKIREEEAVALVDSFLRQEMPRGMIVRRLMDLGAPRTWVEREVRKQRIRES